MFETDRFIAECQRASTVSNSAGVHEIVARTVSNPKEILRVLGEPRSAGLHTLFRSPELTVLNVVWGPRMNQLPHNHNMWAVIGIYTGREDNIFWRRVKGGVDGRIEAVGAKALLRGNTWTSGRKIMRNTGTPPLLHVS